MSLVAHHGATIVEIYFDESERVPTLRELEELNRHVLPGRWHEMKTEENTPLISTPRYSFAPWVEGQMPWGKVVGPWGCELREVPTKGQLLYLPHNSNPLTAARLLELAERDDEFRLERPPSELTLCRARVAFGPGVAGWVYGFEPWEASDDLPRPERFKISGPPSSELVEHGGVTKLKWPPFSNGSWRYSPADDVARLALQGRCGFKIDPDYVVTD